MASSRSSVQKDFFFGWDLLYRTIEGNIRSKSDVLIALAHFVLMKHSDFRCVGVGEDKTLAETEVGSELLPEGWNDDENKYALRYRFHNQLYLLLGHKTDDCIIINLLDVNTKRVSNIGLDPAALVRDVKGNLTTMVPNARELANRYRKELIDPVFMGNTRETTTQTNANAERQDHLRMDPFHPMGPYISVGIEPHPFGLPDVGRDDLDPLGHVGPGNLFEIPSNSEVGTGLRPRFDPFNPPDRRSGQNPNADHLQPPNFGGHDYYI